MSPAVPTRKDPSDPNLSWFDVEDFTPGIYSHSFASGTPTNAPAPLGAADSIGTFGCCALYTGGLGPLPGWEAAVNLDFTPSVIVYLVGLIVNPSLAGTDTELVYMIEQDNGSTHEFSAFSLNVDGVATNALVGIVGTTNPGIFGAPYPTWTRMNLSDPTLAGQPVLVFPASIDDASAPYGHLYVYPSLSAPTAFGVDDLIMGGPQLTGQTFGYQNRILVLSGTPWPWPIAGGFVTNEQINCTDPPNSNVYGDQNEVLEQENPFGYGCAGVISANELYLVKKYNGGVVVTGDILNESGSTYVTAQPGVQPTGDLYGQAAQSTKGLYYASENNGVWLWNGGNSSTKVSAQLDDDFFDVQTDVIQSNNYGFYCARVWGDFVAVSGNYLYNELTGGWWILEPRTDQDYTAPEGAEDALDEFWYCPGRRGWEVYVGALAIPADTTQFAKIYDSRISQWFYQWQSLPLRVVDKRASAMRGLVVHASTGSAANPAGTIQPSVWANGEMLWQGEPQEVPVSSSPQPLRWNVGVVGGSTYSDFAVRFNAQSSEGVGNAAPIIHSFSVGMADRAQTPVPNGPS